MDLDSELTVCHGVELQGAGQGQGDGHLRAGDEAVSGGVGVVTASEIPVVASDDGVLLSLLDVLSIPLTNAGTAGISKDNSCRQK